MLRDEKSCITIDHFSIIAKNIEKIEFIYYLFNNRDIIFNQIFISQFCCIDIYYRKKQIFFNEYFIIFIKFILNFLFLKLIRYSVLIHLWVILLTSITIKIFHILCFIEYHVIYFTERKNKSYLKPAFVLSACLAFYKWTFLRFHFYE